MTAPAHSPLREGLIDVTADDGHPDLGSAPLTFRVLGSLSYLQRGRPTEICGASQRALLATLLAAEGRSVSTGALIAELWGEEPPTTAENSLQAHVSRLRRKLHGGGQDGVQLACLPSGYRLMVVAEQIDVVVFQRAVTRARLCDDAMAEPLLRSALTLWNGDVFGGEVGGPLCRAATARYEAAGTLAHEMLVDLRLRSGQHESVLPQLAELTLNQPLNERFCEQLMVALYRSGRQTEALSTYQAIRARLGDELGVDPSPSLQRLEGAILRHDALLGPGGEHTALRAS